MLEAIPLIGPLLSAVTGLLGPVASIWNKITDKQITQIQSDATVDTAAIQAAAQGNADRLALRIFQDALITPVVAWTDLYIWDQIVAKTHPDWVVPILPWPDQLAYLPYAVFVYLFGAVGLTLWNRRK